MITCFNFLKLYGCHDSFCEIRSTTKSLPLGCISTITKNTVAKLLRVDCIFLLNLKFVNYFTAAITAQKMKVPIRISSVNVTKSAGNHNESKKCISESCIKVKNDLNFYFHTSLWCLKRFYEGYKAF